jgi:hypothetical protein
VRFLAVLILFLASVTHAEPRYGLDVLAGAKYPEQVRRIPNQFAVGLFAETFGDALPVVKRELESGRSFVRVHLLWRDNHSFGGAELKEARKLARRYQSLCAAFPGRIEISPYCEHNVPTPDKDLDKIQAEAPNCKLVNTPWKGGISRRYKNEVHGSHKKPAGPYNYSYDGSNSVDADVEKDKAAHSGADYFFFWHPRFNLKWSLKDQTPRPQRKAKPSRDLVESVEYLQTAKGQTSVPKKWLVKSHAEKHGPEDLKGDKLLIISPKRVNEITLRRGAQKVGTLRYYGPFDGGGFRYYSPSFGYKLGMNLEIWIGSKVYGSINGGFRDGYFR